MAAFDIALEPGWKTYWRAPGDSGIPPRISWQGSENIASIRLHWPRPNVYEDGPRTIGYQERLILPVELRPSTDIDSLQASGTIEIGVCLDVCVPMSFDFDLDVPTEGFPDSEISAALAEVPRAVDGRSMDGLRCTVAPLSDGMKITAELTGQIDFSPVAAVFEHHNREIWVSAATLDQTNALTITADMVPPDAAPFALDRSEIVLTLLGENGALEIHGCRAG